MVKPMSRRRKEAQPEAPGAPPPSADHANVIEDALSTLHDLGVGPSSVPDILNDAAWLRSSGKTPLEFLTAVYRHPLVKMEARISAAKSALEYAHRKLPTTLEMSGPEGTPLKITAAMLAGLSDKELETVQTLLEKAVRAGEAAEGKKG